MTDARMVFAREAEDAACLFLEHRGHNILERNFTTRYGEIDIVSRHENTIVFIEVKARKNKRKGSPREAVPFAKQQKIIGTALHFLRRRNITDARVRFDVVAMMAVSGGFHIELIENAFQGV